MKIRTETPSRPPPRGGGITSRRLSRRLSAGGVEGDDCDECTAPPLSRLAGRVPPARVGDLAHRSRRADDAPAPSALLGPLRLRPLALPDVLLRQLSLRVGRGAARQCAAAAGWARSGAAVGVREAGDARAERQPGYLPVLLRLPKRDGR